MKAVRCGAVAAFSRSPSTNCAIASPSIKRFQLVEFAALNLARRGLALDLDRELADARDRFDGFRLGRDRLCCSRRLRRSLRAQGSDESQCKERTGGREETQERAFLRSLTRP